MGKNSMGRTPMPKVKSKENSKSKTLKGKKLSKHDMSVAKWIELSGELPTKTVPYIDGGKVESFNGKDFIAALLNTRMKFKYNTESQIKEYMAWLLERNVIIKATKEYNGNKYRLKISEIQDVDEDSKYFWNSSHSLNYSLVIHIMFGICFALWIYGSFYAKEDSQLKRIMTECNTWLAHQKAAFHEQLQNFNFLNLLHSNKTKPE